MRRRVRMVRVPLRLLFCWTFFLFALGCCAVPALAQQPGAVAVWDFDDLSPAATEQGVGELLAGQVIQVLAERGEDVVERQRLMLAARELGVGSSELADEETRLKLGRLVGARRMVFGAFLAIGPQIRIDARLVEVETGVVVKAVQKEVASGTVTEWLDAARQAAEELEGGPH